MKVRKDEKVFLKKALSVFLVFCFFAIAINQSSLVFACGEANQEELERIDAWKERKKAKAKRNSEFQRDKIFAEIETEIQSFRQKILEVDLQRSVALNKIEQDEEAFELEMLEKEQRFDFIEKQILSFEAETREMYEQVQKQFGEISIREQLKIDEQLHKVKALNTNLSQILEASISNFGELLLSESFLNKCGRHLQKIIKFSQVLLELGADPDEILNEDFDEELAERMLLEKKRELILARGLDPKSLKDMVQIKMELKSLKRLRCEEVSFDIKNKKFLPFILNALKKLNLGPNLEGQDPVFLFDSDETQMQNHNESKKLYIRAKKPKNWCNICVYIYKESEGIVEKNFDFPGAPMFESNSKETDDFFYVVPQKFNDEKTRIIFCSSDGSNQVPPPMEAGIPIRRFEKHGVQIFNGLKVIFDEDPHSIDFCDVSEGSVFGESSISGAVPDFYATSVYLINSIFAASQLDKISAIDKMRTNYQRRLKEKYGETREQILEKLRKKERTEKKEEEKHRKMLAGLAQTRKDLDDFQKRVQTPRDIHISKRPTAVEPSFRKKTCLSRASVQSLIDFDHRKKPAPKVLKKTSQTSERESVRPTAIKPEKRLLSPASSKSREPERPTEERSFVETSIQDLVYFDASNEKYISYLERIMACKGQNPDSSEYVREASADDLSLTNLENITQEIIKICMRIYVLNGVFPKIVQALTVIRVVDEILNSEDKGAIAQVKTGEGKTFIISIVSAVLVKFGRKVDIVTTTAELAAVGQQEQKQYYDSLGISSGVLLEREEQNNFCEIVSIKPLEARNRYTTEVFDCDIVYSTNSNLEFVHLMNLFCREPSRKRKYDVVIVDEIDNMLIDQNANPAILAKAIQVQDIEAILKTIFKFSELSLEEILDQLDRIFSKSEEYPKKPDRVLVEILKEAANAARSYQKNRDYVIIKTKDGEREIVIIDPNTGIPQSGSRWQGFIHEMIEIKEGIKIKDPSISYCAITQNLFFNLYEKIAGLTGTLGTENDKTALRNEYRVKIFEIPKNKESLKEIIFEKADSIEESFYKTVQSIRRETSRGRPVLIILDSIQSVESFCKFFHSFNGTITGLDPKKDRKIVSLAGNSKFITVATNVAGRGTDIKISNEVEQLGGLHVILPIKPGNQRVLEQAIGRSGRQGQRGSALIIDFCVSYSFQPEFDIGYNNLLLLQEDFDRYLKSQLPWLFQYEQRYSLEQMPVPLKATSFEALHSCAWALVNETFVKDITAKTRELNPKNIFRTLGEAMAGIYDTVLFFNPTKIMPIIKKHFRTEAINEYMEEIDEEKLLIFSNLALDVVLTGWGTFYTNLQDKNEETYKNLSVCQEKYRDFLAFFERYFQPRVDIKTCYKELIILIMNDPDPPKTISYFGGLVGPSIEIVDKFLNNRAVQGSISLLGTVASGMGAFLCCTSGVGTIIGVPVMIFSVSQACEDVHNIFLGIKGDEETQAFNPLKELTQHSCDELIDYAFISLNPSSGRKKIFGKTAKVASKTTDKTVKAGARARAKADRKVQIFTKKIKVVHTKLKKIHRKALISSRKLKEIVNVSDS
ncbi:MAG: starch-binding protein [Oscillospiraceae bacterium]|jgi:hypothetical protein|nr:starch-binding protein [Oscillospiraceae bacterium]